MPRLKPGTIIPNEDEDAILTEAAIADQDARPLTDEEWEATKPKVRIGHASTRAREHASTRARERRKSRPRSASMPMCWPP